jgi:hypothetical protein
MTETRVRIALGALFLFAGVMPVALAADSFAQQARDAGPRPSGTASIAGRVVRENAGVARVAVTLDASDGRGQRQTLTDDDGRFQFERLPAGDSC